MNDKKYLPTWESLNEHHVSKWFQDAKFGIFIHWGIYSVPAWAPEYREAKEYYNERIGYHPYAELYGYGMLYKDTPVWKYHQNTYGSDFQYEDFLYQFKAEKWNPINWAETFKKAGAKYVVLVTQHSDNFCMWNTQYSDFNAYNKGPKRDIVGELTKAVKEIDLKMGLYYSLTFSWHYPNFPHYPYKDYTHNQLKELIDLYSPDLLWPDEYWKPEEKSYADQWGSKDIIAYYYNQANNPDEVLVNDRWGKEPSGLLLGDFCTPEYKVLADIPPYYWEHTRGIGSSFGYKQNDDYLSTKALVHLLIDVVSKNGNLLLNIGPKADGTIPDEQLERLDALGQWLETNGDGIYGTRPWVHPEGITSHGDLIKYTQKENHVYGFIHSITSKQLCIPHLKAAKHTTIDLLGYDNAIAWEQTDQGLCVVLPEDIEATAALTLRITPQPAMLLQKDYHSETGNSTIWRRNGFLDLEQSLHTVSL